MKTQRQILKEQREKQYTAQVLHEKEECMTEIENAVIQMKDSWEQHINLAAKAHAGNQPEIEENAISFALQVKEQIEQAEGMKMNIELALMNINANQVFMNMYQALGRIAKLPIFSPNFRQIAKIRKTMNKMLANIQVTDAMMKETFSSNANFVARPVSQQNSAEIRDLVAARAASMANAGASDIKTDIDNARRVNV